MRANSPTRSMLGFLFGALLFVLASVVPPIAAQAQTGARQSESLPSWVPFSLAVSVQAVAFAYFMGRLSGRVVAMEGKLGEIANALTVGAKRLDDLDDFTGKSATDRATLALRLGQVEKNTEALQSLKEEVLINRTTAGLEMRQLTDRVDKHLDKLERNLRSVQRTVQNALTGQANRVISFSDAESEE